MNRIGIRHEDKFELERRAPLIPQHIGELSKKTGCQFTVEASEKRVFSDQEYAKHHAEISNNLNDCDIIIGVKEMPVNYFLQDKAYLFFSHVIKGQSYNMPMLKSILKAGATLIDYECIADKSGRRLIFFGRFAGMAGMINTLWSIGKRYKERGFSNPFEKLNQAYQYNSLNDAIIAIQEAGHIIRKNGLPEAMTPLLIAVTGDGNVSQGAIEILENLPVSKRSPDDIIQEKELSDSPLQWVNILPEHYLTHVKSLPFDLKHYFDHPNEYQSHFEKFLPEINVLVNGIYWDERYPRLVTKEWLKRAFESNDMKLEVIGDISCDIHGSIECTEIATEIHDPVFVYHPKSDSYTMGFKGSGIAVMSVDILPSELPRESSIHFSTTLKDYIPQLCSADFNAPFSDLELPEEIKQAIIVYRGALTERYNYLNQFID